MATGDSHPELDKLVRRRLAASGGMTFAEFMDLCLYQPEYGYYMGSRTRIGKGGDFFTSSSVHALFGGLLARQLQQMAELLGEGPFTVVEQGAGEGHLAADILEALRHDAPQLYRRLDYCLVEVSAEHRQLQRQRLAEHGARVRWSEPEHLEPFTGCFLSNELVDAFPVHLVEKQAGQLREVYVVLRDGELVEELGPLSTPRIAEHFRWLGVEPAEGNRAEVNLRAPQWLQEIGRRLQRGFVLTIDYGYPAPELFAPHRRGGTLMCYHRHRSSENPYERLGRQDITAHVDFTALEKAGEEAGLETLWFGEQYRFLMALGFVERLMELQARATDEKQARALRMTLKNLILPDGGMGDTFKVLIQGKEVGSPELLCARSLQAIPLPPEGF